MNLRTPICDLFDIDVPIFLAGMGGVAYAEVCAAVSEAGGYGTLGMARPYCSPEVRSTKFGSGNLGLNKRRPMQNRVT